MSEVSAREQIKAFFGSESHLSEREIKAIGDLLEADTIDGMEIAKDFDIAVNSFSLNAELFGHSIARIEGDDIHEFIKYMIFTYIHLSAKCYRAGRYDLRNEDACRNANMIANVWTELESALSSEMRNKAEAIANYWSIHTHRTLQQSLMRVLFCYIKNRTDKEYAEISDIIADASMRFI